MLGIAKKIFGSSNDRSVKGMLTRVQAINALEPTYAALSDAQLRAKTDEFKAALAAGKTLDDILPEAFATVREAARRTLGQRHFDVQLMGGAQAASPPAASASARTVIVRMPIFSPLPIADKARSVDKALKGKAVALTGPRPVLKSRARASRAVF